MNVWLILSLQFHIYLYYLHIVSYLSVIFSHEGTKMFLRLAGSSAILQTLSLGHPSPLSLSCYICVTGRVQRVMADGNFPLPSLCFKNSTFPHWDVAKLTKLLRSRYFAIALSCEWHSVLCLTGMLVVNVTWRNKTYVGTLLDCTRHDWAPPR